MIEPIKMCSVPLSAELKALFDMIDGAKLSVAQVTGIDLASYGVSITKDGQRIAPPDFYSPTVERHWPNPATFAAQSA